MTDHANKGFRAEEQDIAGGKSQEWQFAWDSLASTIKDKLNWSKRNFRFEIQNGDNDGAGRTSQLFWNSNADDQWNSVFHQGYVITETCHPENHPENFCYQCGTTGIKKDIASENFIKVFSNYIEFAEKCNFRIYNVMGILINEGYKSKSVNTIGLKKGLYIVKANNSYVKFIK